MVEAERALRPAAARPTCSRRRSASPTRVSRSPRSRPPNGRDPRRYLRADAEAARVYLPGGRPPARRRGVPQSRSRGELPPASRPAAARRSTPATSRGASPRCSARHGGALAAADLADYDAEWVAPLSTTYRGWTVYELPPNGQGIAALMMLNLLEQLSDRPLRTQLGRGAAHADRGEEARLRRHGPAPRRPGVPRDAGRDAAVEGVRGAAARARSIRGTRTPASRPATCRPAAATRPI